MGEYLAIHLSPGVIGGAQLQPDEDLDGSSIPVAVAVLRRTLASADAVLIATPEYNASIPGALTNALDWASRPFPDNCLRDKQTAVIGARTGLFGTVWAQAELLASSRPAAQPSSVHTGAVA